LSQPWVRQAQILDSAKGRRADVTENGAWAILLVEHGLSGVVCVEHMACHPVANDVDLRVKNPETEGMPKDSVPSSKQWPASAPREHLYLMSEDEQLGFALQVTAPQWSQRAEQAANDELLEREQQSGASSAGTKSAMLAEKLHGECRD
jgi:hypothetical protein